MKIAIVDDFQDDRDTMKNIVKEFVDEKNISATIDVFDGGEKFLETYTPNKFDVLILDIYMYEKTGMDVASYIREKGDKCKIIFATSTMDFAVESYEVRAIYYILKPLEKEKMKNVLSLCMETKEKVIEVIFDRAPLEIPYSKIFWAETYRNSIVIHLENQDIRTYLTFQKFSELVTEDSRFIVSCKGCIVNMDHIHHVGEWDFILKNGTSVQIRKRNGKQVKNSYLTYVCKKYDT